MHRLALRLFSPLLGTLLGLLLQGCAHAPRATPPVPAHRFTFSDGGHALYFVLDRPAAAPAARTVLPDTFVFVVAGSDCIGMARSLPQYFDGLQAESAPLRVFLLQKRFIGLQSSEPCGEDFVRADHPAQWIRDQTEFMTAELAAALANGQRPRRVLVAGISEGAEIAPVLARRFAAVTHVALLANGGMDPFIAYRLQMERHGWDYAVADVAARCTSPASDAEHAAGRTCRYWRELRALPHTANLLALQRPVFMAMGEADDMVPVESARFIRDAFAAGGKSNLELLTLPGADHAFVRFGRSELPSVWAAVSEWMQR
ncbi:alpha/beta hydrolase [Oxalobacteraceae bacterium OM1]|nr:alpha/beta hydrolase [Oxalobacteraceae bacterium OM1]